jgi:hypothetical protein
MPRATLRVPKRGHRQLTCGFSCGSDCGTGSIAGGQPTITTPGLLAIVQVSQSIEYSSGTHHHARPASDCAGQPVNRVFERHRNRQSATGVISIHHRNGGSGCGSRRPSTKHIPGSSPG